MATKRTHLNRIGVAILVAAAALAAAPHALAYGWPVKPFDKPHPVRANFGDPRTTFRGPPTLRTLLSAGGVFAFHFGVDIAAPDGTAVYAVRDGVVSLKSGTTVHVDSAGDFATEYWHIRPVVRDGQHVDAYRTILGYITKGHEHVHFTELDGHQPVNPLVAGHLDPYDDATRPTVNGISFRWNDTGRDVPAEFLRGRVVMVADASDTPALPVPGLWGALPVAPALVTWHVERAKDGKVVLAERTAFDVRRTIPPNDAFWRYYARGTRQNMANFGTHRFWRSPGVYLYKLTPRPFDTHRLPNGIYRLVVTAADTAGNRASLAQVITVLN